MDQPKVDQPKTRRNKKERLPVNGNTRNILTVSNKEPGYKYRWVLDGPDRVSRLEDAWYEPVTNEDGRHRVGDRKVDTSAGTSSLVEVRAGGGRKYLLMRIPEELYNEGRAAKAKAIDAAEAEMRREATEGRYGKLDIDRSGRVDAPVGS